MRKLFTVISTILLTASMVAQPPQKMSYQAVIRNSSDQLVTNHAVGMRVSILQGSSNGTAVYVETQTPTTNANGLVTIEIGGGTPVTGTFAAIVWSAGTYFIKTETDPTGGTNYTITGTSQLLSVPYALHAKTAENGFSGNYIDLTNKPTLFDGNYNSLLNLPTLFNGQYSNLTGIPTFASVATSGNYNDLINKPTLFNGIWISLTGKPTTIAGYGIIDAMTTAHPANGITSINITNWNSAFSWGNHTGLYRPISYVPAWSEVTGKPTLATIATSGSYADLSNQPIIPTTTSQLTNNSGFLTSEVQALSISNDTIYLSNGGFAKLPKSAWSLLGNAGTIAGTNFIGTTDAKDFVIKTNNTEKMRVSSTGKVGIGINNGTFPLEVCVPSTSGSQMNLKLTNLTLGIGYGVGILFAPDDAAIAKMGIFVERRGSWGLSTMHFLSRTSPDYASADLSNSVMAIISNGNVGIGTISPLTKLEVNGVITTTGGNSTSWNTAYSWGNHTSAGYLKTEVDPTFTATFDLTGAAIGDYIAFTGGKWMKKTPGFAVTNHTHTDATTSVSGFLSGADKTKLDKIQFAGATIGDILLFNGTEWYSKPGANVFSLLNHNHNDVYSLLSHIHNDVTYGVSGFMTSADKMKLDGITPTDGSETKIIAGANIAVVGSGTSSDPYVVAHKPHTIGETYGGGVVFYVYDNGQHGLIAATVDASVSGTYSLRWIYNAPTARTAGAGSNGIGAGKTNTLAMLAMQYSLTPTAPSLSTFSAAVAASNYFALDAQGVRYGDWYLPSSNEMILATQSGVVPNLASYYWSSNEASDNSNYAFAIYGGSITVQGKDGSFRVRAIRAF